MDIGHPGGLRGRPNMSDAKVACLEDMLANPFGIVLKKNVNRRSRKLAQDWGDAAIIHFETNSEK
jgi:hypothetical protein